MNRINLKTKRLTPTTCMPTRETEHAAGFDLRADISNVIAPGDRQLVPTGLSVAIPHGYVGLVCPRSGLALKRGVTVLNAPGVIDSDFTGEIGVILINRGIQDFAFNYGDRIAQLLIVPLANVVPIEVDFLPETKRGNAGFGSTGVQ